MNLIETVQPRKNAFGLMTSNLMASAPIARLSPSSELSKEERRQQLRRFVSAYEDSQAEILQKHGDFQKVRQAIVESHVWSDRSAPEEKPRIKKEILAVHTLPRPEFTDIMCAELMVLEPETIYRLMVESLRQTSIAVAKTLYQMLQGMQTDGIVGKMDRLSDEVCKYTFFRRWRFKKQGQSFFTTKVEEVTKKRLFRETLIVREKVRREHTTIEVIERHEEHEHHLYNANWLQAPATSLKKPAFATEHLTSLPSWLHQYVFVAEGDMNKEIIKSHDVPVRSRQYVSEVDRETIGIRREVENTGRLYSPAVTLGDFVLTGWSGRDM